MMKCLLTAVTFECYSEDVKSCFSAGDPMPLTRLLPLLSLLSLSSVSPSQDRRKTPAVPETCSVTKPADRPFVPPAPYPAKPSRGQFWFGTDGLWTSLPVIGTWGKLGHYTSADPT